MNNKDKTTIQINASVIGNGSPITSSGFVVDHDAVMPDGTRLKLPAGTLLYMPTPGVGEGYVQNSGVAARRPDAKDPRDGDA